MLSAFLSSRDRVASTGTFQDTRMAALAILAGAIVILVLSFFTPKHNWPHCVHSVPLGATATIAYNCDSLLIAQTADDLGTYLTEHSMWRTRPVHILFVAAVGNVLAPATGWLTEHIEARVPDLKNYIPDPPRLLPYFYAGVVFNALILALTYFALIGLLPGLSPLARAGAAGVLASFDVTVAWFWVPHQVLMNVLMPLGAAVAFLVGARLRQLTRGQIGAAGLATALFALAYPYALAWPITFCLGAVYGWQTWTGPGIRDAIGRLAIYGAAFAALALAWFVPYLLLFGDGLSHEANLGQFRWLPAAIQEGELISTFVAHVVIVAGFLVHYGGPLGFALLLALFASLFALARTRSPRALGDPVLVAAAATLVVMVIFNFLQGYHPGRLVLFPLLLLVLATTRALLLMGATRTATAYLFAVTATQIALALTRPALSQE